MRQIAVGRETEGGAEYRDLPRSEPAVERLRGYRPNGGQVKRDLGGEE